MKKLKLLCVFAILCMSGFVLCSCGEKPIEVSLSSIKSEITLGVGESADALAFAVATGVDLENIAVISNNAEVVEYTEGKLQAKAVGQSIISFTYENKTALLNVNVVDKSKQLLVPQGLKFENGKFVWQAVEHAQAYKIEINGREVTVPLCEYEPTEQEEAQESLTAKVCSLGGVGYINSGYSKTLQTKTLDIPEASYTAIEQANFTEITIEINISKEEWLGDAFVIFLNGNKITEKEVTSENVTSKKLIYKTNINPEPGQEFIYSVQHLSKLQSEEIVSSKVYSFEKITMSKAPEITKINNVFSFSSTQTTPVYSYKIIKSSTEEVVAENDNLTESTVSISELSAGNYTIIVNTKKSTHFFTSKSASSNFIIKEKLQTPQIELSDENNKILKLRSTQIEFMKSVKIQSPKTLYIVNKEDLQIAENIISIDLKNYEGDLSSGEKTFSFVFTSSDVAIYDDSQSLSVVVYKESTLSLPIKKSDNDNIIATQGGMYKIDGEEYKAKTANDVLIKASANEGSHEVLFYNPAQSHTGCVCSFDSDIKSISVYKKIAPQIELSQNNENAYILTIKNYDSNEKYYLYVETTQKSIGLNETTNISPIVRELINQNKKIKVITSAPTQNLQEEFYLKSEFSNGIYVKNISIQDAFKVAADGTIYFTAANIIDSENYTFTFYQDGTQKQDGKITITQAENQTIITLKAEPKQTTSNGTLYAKVSDFKRTISKQSTPTIDNVSIVNGEVTFTEKIQVYSRPENNVAGGYTIFAEGADNQSLNSQPFSFIIEDQTLTGLTHSNGIVSWNAIQNATYAVNVCKNNIIVLSETNYQENTMDIANLLTTEGNYVVKVKVNSRTTANIIYLESDEALTETISITKLEAPLFSFDKSTKMLTCSFTNGTCIVIKNGQKQSLTADSTNKKYSIDLSSESTFPITFHAYCQQEGKIKSDDAQITIQKLSLAENLKVNGQTLSFNSVSGASEYVVSYQPPIGEKITKTITATTLSELPVGSYNVYVTAKSNELNILDSEDSSISVTVTKQLKTPTLSFDYDLKTLTWETIENATAYQIYLNASFKEIATATSFTVSADQPGTYVYKIIAISNGDYEPSGDSNSITVKKLSAPTLESITSNGTTLSWSGVDGAESYTLNYEGLDSPINTQTCQQTNMPTGEYNVSIKATATNNAPIYFIESEIVTKELVFTQKLKTPSVSFDYENKKLKWEAVDHAGSYYIFKGDEKIEEITVTQYSVSPDFAGTLSVKAISPDNEKVFLTGELSNIITFVKAPKITEQPAVNANNTLNLPTPQAGYTISVVYEGEKTISSLADGTSLNYSLKQEPIEKQSGSTVYFSSESSAFTITRHSAPSSFTIAVDGEISGVNLDDVYITLNDGEKLEKNSFMQRIKDICENKTETETNSFSFKAYAKGNNITTLTSKGCKEFTKTRIGQPIISKSNNEIDFEITNICISVYNEPKTLSELNEMIKSQGTYIVTYYATNSSDINKLHSAPKTTTVTKLNSPVVSIDQATGDIVWQLPTSQTCTVTVNEGVLEQISKSTTGYTDLYTYTYSDVDQIKITVKTEKIDNQNELFISSTTTETFIREDAFAFSNVEESAIDYTLNTNGKQALVTIKKDETNLLNAKTTSIPKANFATDGLYEISVVLFGENTLRSPKATFKLVKLPGVTNIQIGHATTESISWQGVETTGYATTYELWLDNVKLTEITDTTFSLSGTTIEKGQHTFTVVAKVAGENTIFIPSIKDQSIIKLSAPEIVSMHGVLTLNLLAQQNYGTLVSKYNLSATETAGESFNNDYTYDATTKQISEELSGLTGTITVSAKSNTDDPQTLSSDTATKVFTRFAKVEISNFTRNDTDSSFKFNQGGSVAISNITQNENAIAILEANNYQSQIPYACFASNGIYKVTLSGYNDNENVLKGEETTITLIKLPEVTNIKIDRSSGVETEILYWETLTEFDGKTASYYVTCDDKTLLSPYNLTEAYLTQGTHDLIVVADITDNTILCIPSTATQTITKLSPLQTAVVGGNLTLAMQSENSGVIECYKLSATGNETGKTTLKTLNFTYSYGYSYGGEGGESIILDLAQNEIVNNLKGIEGTISLTSKIYSKDDLTLSSNKANVQYIKWKATRTPRIQDGGLLFDISTEEAMISNKEPNDYYVVLENINLIIGNSKVYYEFTNNKLVPMSDSDIISEVLYPLDSDRIHLKQSTIVLRRESKNLEYATYITSDDCSPISLNPLGAIESISINSSDPYNQKLEFKKLNYTTGAGAYHYIKRYQIAMYEMVQDPETGAVISYVAVSNKIYTFNDSDSETASILIDNYLEEATYVNGMFYEGGKCYAYSVSAIADDGSCWTDDNHVTYYYINNLVNTSIIWTYGVGKPVLEMYEGMIRWKTVDYATNYYVYVNNDLMGNQNISYDSGTDYAYLSLEKVLGDRSAGSTYSVTVRAIGELGLIENTLYYVQSQKSIELSVEIPKIPSAPKIVKGQIKWEGTSDNYTQDNDTSTNHEKIELYFYKAVGGSETNTRSINVYAKYFEERGYDSIINTLASYNDSAPSAGKYMFKIRQLGNSDISHGMCNGSYTEPIEICVINAVPNVTINDGKLMFDAIEFEHSDDFPNLINPVYNIYGKEISNNGVKWIPIYQIVWNNEHSKYETKSIEITVDENQIEIIDFADSFTEVSLNERGVIEFNVSNNDSRLKDTYSQFGIVVQGNTLEDGNLQAYISGIMACSAEFTVLTNPSILVDSKNNVISWTGNPKAKEYLLSIYCNDCDTLIHTATILNSKKESVLYYEYHDLALLLEENIIDINEVTCFKFEVRALGDGKDSLNARVVTESERFVLLPANRIGLIVQNGVLVGQNITNTLVVSYDNGDETRTESEMPFDSLANYIKDTLVYLNKTEMEFEIYQKGIDGNLSSNTITKTFKVCPTVQNVQINNSTLTFELPTEYALENYKYVLTIYKEGEQIQTIISETTSIALSDLIGEIENNVAYNIAIQTINSTDQNTLETTFNLQSNTFITQSFIQLAPPTSLAITHNIVNFVGNNLEGGETFKIKYIDKDGIELEHDVINGDTLDFLVDNYYTIKIKSSPYYESANLKTLIEAGQGVLGVNVNTARYIESKYSNEICIVKTIFNDPSSIIQATKIAENEYELTLLNEDYIVVYNESEITFMNQKATIIAKESESEIQIRLCQKDYYNKNNEYTYYAVASNLFNLTRILI